MLVSEDEGLRKWVVHAMGDDRCPCEYAWKSLGRLYGVSFGKGWVRLTTEPDCPHHGAARLSGHGCTEWIG
jgi:hypothetical protein